MSLWQQPLLAHHSRLLVNALGPCHPRPPKDIRALRRLAFALCRLDSVAFNDLVQMVSTGRWESRRGGEGEVCPARRVPQSKLEGAFEDCTP